MPTNTFSGIFSLTGNAQIVAADGAVWSPQGAVTIGSGFPAVSTGNLANGTGNQQANTLYVSQFSVSAGGNTDIDLAGGLTDFRGNTITFTAIKMLLLAISSPDGTKKLRVGPQGVSNAAQLWFGGVGATVYEEVFDAVCRWNTYAGWGVTAGTGDILRVNNPGAGAVSANLILIGVQ